MNAITKYIKRLFAVSAALTLLACTSQPDVDLPEKEEGELRMGVSFGSRTRLAELPNANAMAEDHNGLNDVGLYVYYTHDYNNGIVTRPYIRNVRCTVENGELLVVPGANANPADTRIFIYDEMTLVAFYPYNADAPDFQTKADEEKYVITRRDYSQQYYIPYRAQTATNPTVSYYTQLNFVPKHVYKIEVLVVADDPSLFPAADGLQVLPTKDPLENTDETDGMREKWYDVELVRGNDGTGSDIRRYTSYIWTNDGTDGNPIRRGDVLMQSADGQFTLIASQDVNVQEQYIYRYGYNLSTGEIFIPTSSNLINDVTSLAEVNNTNTNYYQVCDIDMSQGNWTPINLLGGRYDGGGHALNGMTIDTSGDEAGLFARIQANATVCNVNLVDPVITVNSTADSVAVGGIAGLVNRPLTDADREQLIGNFPPELSEIVKRALIEELLAGMGDNQSSIVASRVINPTITVNGKSPRVGTVAGNAGSRDDSGTYRSSIRDTYSTGGSIKVNVGQEENNETAYVGGLIGVNNGYVTRSYTTTSDITAEKITDTGSGTELQNAAVGFANMGMLYSPAEGGIIEQSFAVNDDPNSGVTRFSEGWPGANWINYTGIWPVNTTSWLGAPNRSFWYSTGTAPSIYPTLQWERR